MSNYISLVNYADTSQVVSAKNMVRGLEFTKTMGLILTIGVLAIGILFFTLMVHKYQFTLHKPLPVIHFGVTLGVPCALAVIFSGVSVGTTCALHKKLPEARLLEQFPQLL